MSCLREGGALDGHLPIPHTGLLEQVPPRVDDAAVVSAGRLGAAPRMQNGLQMALDSGVVGNANQSQ